MEREREREREHRYRTYVKYEGTDGKYSGAGQEYGTGYLEQENQNE